MLFASGAIAVETFVKSRKLDVAEPVLATVLLLGGIALAPFALAVLAVETYIRYSNALGIKPESDERDRAGKLPQHYADMFGWKEMADSVNEVYQKLSPEEKKDCGIYAQNYGEAAAIDFFGRKYGMPHAISGHNTYWLWGPGSATGKTVIVLGGDEEDLKRVYHDYHQAGIIQNEYARSFETNIPIYVCHGLKIPIKEIWPRTRNYI